MADELLTFLIIAEAVINGDVMTIMPLGAGQEVGRSAVLLRFREKTILFDAGVHPAYDGLAALPFFDVLDDPAQIDLLLCTHFHLDHCASVPYVLEKTSFKGRTFMTHPTKAIFQLILADYVRVSGIGRPESQLYTEEDLQNCMPKIELINYHQEMEVAGIKFWCYNAGHVLGAAMFMVDIDGVKILYTGDYSREEDRHLMAAEIPAIPPDVLIVEATYGTQVHEPQAQREARFCKRVRDIVVNRGGKCLLPVFALGRSQELLLILDELWEQEKEIFRGIPILYASLLAERSMAVYQTYPNMMNERIRREIAISNPFVFNHVSNMTNAKKIDDAGPCVVLASPGMLQSGLSRELFEKWCEDPKNGLIVTGYSVSGTLAKDVIAEPTEVTALNGHTLKMRMSVDAVSFSAHADFAQTTQFIDVLQPPHIVLVHGEAHTMSRLHTALVSKFAVKKMQVYSPKNCEEVTLTFSSEKSAKAVGQLVASQPVDGQALSGVLVRKDFTYTLMAPSDLPTYTQLATTRVQQTLRVPFYQPFHICIEALADVFDRLEETDTAALKARRLRMAIERGEATEDEIAEQVVKEGKGNVGVGSASSASSGSGSGGGGGGNAKAEPMDTDADEAKNDARPGAAGADSARRVVLLPENVTLTHESDTELLLEWQATPVTDMIADAALSCLLGLQTSVRRRIGGRKMPYALRAITATTLGNEATRLAVASNMKGEKRAKREPDVEDLCAQAGLDVSMAMKAERANVAVRLLRRAYGTLRLAETRDKDVVYDSESDSIRVDTERIVVDLSAARVECDDEAIKTRLQNSIDRLFSLLPKEVRDDEVVEQQHVEEEDRVEEKGEKMSQ